MRARRQTSQAIAALQALRPDVAGSQGKLWAIAPMLAEGSQAWGMRLVAGADLDGAERLDCGHLAEAINFRTMDRVAQAG